MNKRTKKKPSPFPKIILGVIIVTFFAVVIAVVCSFVFTPEKITTDKIDALSKDYYENYLYENLINSSAMSDQDHFETVMEKYQEHGFGIVHLRQILSQAKNKSSQDIAYITDYCDENKTIVVFYPDPPFNRTSYHIEYSYSCNF